MLGPRITRHDINLELLDDPNGIGCFAKFDSDGFLEELYWFYKGVRGGPSLTFHGPHYASLHSGNDISWTYKGTTVEEFSKFDDHSKPYPYDWTEWVEESLAHVSQFSVIEIAEYVRARAAQYQQWEAPKRSRLQRTSSFINGMLGFGRDCKPTPPTMPRHLREDLDRVNGA